MDTINRKDEFNRHLSSNINANYQIIQDIFNREYGFLALDPLRDEICKCFMCGLYQSMITLTNHLLEKSLKFCLASKYSFENKSEETEIEYAFIEGINKYDDAMLQQSINAACSQGLITKSQKKELGGFRDKFRNPYSHAFIKIFEGIKVKAKVVTTDDLKNGFDEFFKNIFDTTTDKEMPLENLPFAQGIFQVMIAKEDSFPYFKRVDEIIRDMLQIIKEKEYVRK